MSIFGISKDVFEFWRNAHEKDYKRLLEKYYELAGKHALLLKHLGLEQVETYEIKLRKSSDRASDGRE